MICLWSWKKAGIGHSVVKPIRTVIVLVHFKNDSLGL